LNRPPEVKKVKIGIARQKRGFGRGEIVQLKIGRFLS
jgi:hypothetical protein